MGLLPENHSKIAKLHSNSDPLLLIELLVYQSLQQTCLAHARITNDYYLEEYVVRNLGCCLIHGILIHHSAW